MKLYTRRYVRRLGVFCYILTVSIKHLLKNSNVFSSVCTACFKFMVIKEKNDSSLRDKVLSHGRFLFN